MLDIKIKHGHVADFLIESGYGIYNLDGEWIYDKKNEDAIKAIVENFDPLPELRRQALQRLNDEYQSYMQNIEDQYPEFEKRTWPTQKAEAEAWENDKNTLTPLLDTIAQSRGMGRDELCQKTLDKSKGFNLLAATLAGNRQRQEDELFESTDEAFIMNIKADLPNG